MLIGTDVTDAGAPNRLRRWLRADLADLVDVSGSRGGLASAARPADLDAGPASFEDDLRRLRRRVLRRWAVAAAGRYALAAPAIAVVPAALAAFGLIDRVWALIVPVALFVVALALRLLRPPSLGQVARLLDDRLGLFDVTATALQVERSGDDLADGPAAPVFAEAAALLRAGASAWRPRSRLGSRQLAVAAGLVVLLAAIAVAGTRSGGSGSTKVTAVATPGRARHKGAGPNSVSPPLAPPRAKRGSKKGLPPSRKHLSPLGLYDYGFEGRRQLPHFGTGKRTGLQYPHGVPRSQGRQPFSTAAVGEGSEAREKAEEEAAKANASPSSGHRERGSEPPESLKQLAIGGIPPTGSVSPVPNSGSTPASPAADKSPGSASSPSNSAAAGQRAAAGAAGRQGGGRPSGSATAGHQRAALGSGSESSEGGHTGGALPLRAGFAAVKSGKAATSRGPRDAQGGGGPGRSAGISGSAFEEAAAGSLGYVPPDAGVSAGLDPGLFARYLNALAQIEGRRW